MTVSERVLQKLADWRPPGEGRRTLAVPDEGSGWSLGVTADRRDAVGCVLWELTLQCTAPERRQGVTLGGWAQKAAEHASGLLESLAVHEVDPVRGEALLRSTKPTARGDRRGYYEVLLQGTTRATLRRYEAPSQLGARREQVPFALTHDALAKVITDLTQGP